MNQYIKSPLIKIKKNLSQPRHNSLCPLHHERKTMTNDMLILTIILELYHFNSISPSILSISISTMIFIKRIFLAHVTSLFFVFTSPSGKDPVHNPTFANHQVHPIRCGCTGTGADII